MYIGNNMKEQYYSYVYRITHVKSGYHYYGSRFMSMNRRFSSNALEDLKRYQSSSRNIEWKDKIKTSPEEFKFKIIKKFYDTRKVGELKALNYEGILHNKFDVINHPKFINRHNEPILDIKKYLSTIFMLIDYMGNEVYFRWNDVDKILKQYNIQDYKSTLINLINTSISDSPGRPTQHVCNILFNPSYYKTYVEYIEPKFYSNQYSIYSDDGNKIKGTYYQLIHKLQNKVKDANKVVHGLTSYNMPYYNGYYNNLQNYIDYNKTMCKLINVKSKQIFKLSKINRKKFAILSKIDNANIHNLINYNGDVSTVYNGWMRIEQYNKLINQVYKITDGKTVKYINKLTQNTFMEQNNYTNNCFRLFGGDLKVYDKWFTIDYWISQRKSLGIIIDIHTKITYNVNYWNKQDICDKLNIIIQENSKIPYDISKYIMHLFNNNKSILNDRFMTIENYKLASNTYIIVTNIESNENITITKISIILNNTHRIIFHKLKHAKIGAVCLGHKLVNTYI